MSPVCFGVINNTSTYTSYAHDQLCGISQLFFIMLISAQVKDVGMGNKVNLIWGCQKKKGFSLYQGDSDMATVGRARLKFCALCVGKSSGVGLYLKSSFVPQSARSLFIGGVQSLREAPVYKLFPRFSEIKVLQRSRVHGH